MKQLLSLILVIIAIAFPSVAQSPKGNSQESVKLEYNRADNGNKPIRAPMRINIEVFYDTETHIVEVYGDEAMDAEVFIYNASGDIVDYSSSLNTELTIPASGIYTIQIESEGWYALGVIEAQ